MKKLLQKIAWRTRRWNFKFNLLDVYLHDGDQCWGFSFCEVVKDYVPYSLLSIEFRLPNGAERQRVQWTNWDFLFLSTPLYRWTSGLEEDVLWGHKPTLFQKIGLSITNKLFK
jgi:hypothetical protein